MQLEGIMLREISQRHILYDITYMWNLRKPNLATENGDYQGLGFGQMGGYWLKSTNF